MELDQSKGAPPLYSQLREVIEAKIRSGEYPVGSLLPSELEFEKEYSLSRVTVRQALNDLAAEGLVLRKRGKGTIVQSGKLLNESLSSVKSFTEEMNERGIRPGTICMECTSEQAGGDVAELLRIPPGEMVCKILRIRSGDDLPVVVFETWLKQSCQPVVEELASADSLYALLKKHGIVIRRVNDRYTAGLANETIARLLEIPVGSAVFKRARVSFDSWGNTVEYTKCSYNGSLYSYSLELQGG